MHSLRCAITVCTYQIGAGVLAAASRLFSLAAVQTADTYVDDCSVGDSDSAPAPCPFQSKADSRLGVGQDLAQVSVRDSALSVGMPAA